MFLILNFARQSRVRYRSYTEMLDYDSNNKKGLFFLSLSEVIDCERYQSDNHDA